MFLRYDVQGGHAWGCGELRSDWKGKQGVASHAKLGGSCKASFEADGTARAEDSGWEGAGGSEAERQAERMQHSDLLRGRRTPR